MRATREMTSTKRDDGKVIEHLFRCRMVLHGVRCLGPKVAQNAEVLSKPIYPDMAIALAVRPAPRTWTYPPARWP